LFMLAIILTHGLVGKQAILRLWRCVDMDGDYATSKSFNSQILLVIPAAIADLTLSVRCTRHKL
jgi:hypothetical protein